MAEIRQHRRTTGPNGAVAFDGFAVMRSTCEESNSATKQPVGVTASKWLSTSDQSGKSKADRSPKPKTGVCIAERNSQNMS